MGYVTLGSRGPLLGGPDTSGLNPGNWTIRADQSVWVTQMPYFECYRMTVNGKANSTMKIYLNQKLWEVSIPGGVNSWEGIQPMLLGPSDELFFCWDNPATDGLQPSATLWLRYDDSIQANAVTAGKK